MPLFFCKGNANRMQNVKLAWIFCCDAAFLLQRKCKSNAECQACLNILLRCRFSSAKIQHISAVCSKTEWLVKQNSERKARSSDVSCCVCVNYMGNDFCVFPMALLVKNSTFASKFQTPERAMYYVTLYHQKALHAPTRPEHPCTPCTPLYTTARPCTPWKGRSS